MTKAERKKQQQSGRQVTLGAIDPGFTVSGGRAIDPNIGVSVGNALDSGIYLSAKKPNSSSSRTQGVPAAAQTAVGTNVSRPTVLKGSNQIRALTADENPYSSSYGSSYASSAGRSTGGSTGSSGYTLDAGRPSYTPKYQSYIDTLLANSMQYGDYISPYQDRIDNALSGIENYGPYVSPYQERMDKALSDIENYGPYSSPYADQITAQWDAINNRDPFSYNYEEDPAWQAYKLQYMREGRRAQEDALGQYAAMTGGMPSTAAMAAASQAGDYYAAQMNDKIPELYKLAYDMYNQEGNNMYSKLNALRGLESDDYGRWNDVYNRMLTGYNALQNADATEYGRYGDTYNRMLTDLDALRNMDATEYGRYIDTYNRNLQNLDAYRTAENDNYNQYRDTVGDWERDRAFDYAAEQDALEWDYRNRAYADERADAEWEKAYKERAYGDSRADTQWERDYEERAYNDTRADKEREWSYKLGEIGPKIYAYGNGEPYEIGSAKGQQFISSAGPGQTMVGGDGSVWTKNEDGSTTITRGGETWTVAAPVVASSGGGGGRGSGGGGGTKTGSGKWSAVDDWVAMYGDDAAEDYIREHYKELGFSSMSAALSGWKNHLLEIGYEKPKTYEKSSDSLREDGRLDSHDVMHGIRDDMGLNSVAGTGWGVNTNTGGDTGKSAGVQSVENSIAGMSVGLSPDDVSLYATYAIEDAYDNGEITKEEAEDLINKYF